MCVRPERLLGVLGKQRDESDLRLQPRSSGLIPRPICANDGVRVACTSSDGSGVRFPAAALDAYSHNQADAYAASHDLGPDAYEWALPPEESNDYSYRDEPPDDEDYGGYSDDDGYSEDDYGGTLPGENIPNYDNGRGFRVQCNDGTYSKSGGIQGACSHHGGVAP